MRILIAEDDQVLADVRDESVDYLAAAISENAERIFGKF